MTITGSEDPRLPRHLGHQAAALVSPAETLNKDVAPIGDETEPIETSREKVEL